MPPTRPSWELVDGLVRPRAVPTVPHQRVKTVLHEGLAGWRCRSMTVVMDLEVRVDDLLRRRPDVLVVRAAGAARAVAAVRDLGWVAPEHVVLAVEVVCRGSETTDRKHKRVEYADADIRTTGGWRPPRWSRCIPTGWARAVSF